MSWYLLILYLIIRSYEIQSWLSALLISLVLPAYCYYYKSVNYKYIIIGIVVVSIIYYLAYIGQGIYTELILSGSRFDSQGITWAGSSYAVFYFLIALPCAILLIKGKTKYGIVLGIAVFIIAAVTAWYYDSRILKIVLAIFTIIVIPVNNYIKLTSSIITAVIFMMLIHPFTSDYDRIAGILAPIKSLEHNTWFGYGCKQHHVILPEYFKQYIAYSNEYTWSTSFARYTTDYGIAGLALFGSLFASAFAAAWKSKERVLLTVMVVIGAGWIFINDISNNFVWWLLFVPYGILYKFGQSSQ